MARRGTLLLALAACLVAGAAAALPSQLFKNAGGPSFLDGPSYDWKYTTESVVTIGLTHQGNYSFAMIGADGGVETEIATYTSWECGPEPGSYLALAMLKLVDSDGNVVDEKEVCEFGYVFDDLMRNTWAQSEDACPTEVTEENRFLGDRAEKNSCGTPARRPAAGPSLADLLQDDLADAPSPAA
ncbi:hypothetical protein C2E20_7837 [Micractinium conductrix]|uniref:Uncharacterized protein n=1 Tax=Micractinium conductrix TaxID=554055 RepID=A0A2P6V3I8_9CHLO|nr:hypothetical protein C2E20_7837 [Micractinium conductrix]|eukprot:PSC68652.1 hypothetical protein C2E20_7837 [Micractinium conductrix]